MVKDHKNKVIPKNKKQMVKDHKNKVIPIKRKRRVKKMVKDQKKIG